MATLQRPHLRRPSTLDRQRPSCTNTKTQIVVEKIVEAVEADTDSAAIPEQQLTVAIRNAPDTFAPTAAAIAPAPHRSKKPLPSIIKKKLPRIQFVRHKHKPSSGRSGYWYEAIPLSKMAGGKKSVRLSIPGKHGHVRPSSSVSPTESSSHRPSSSSSRKRSVTSHPRSEDRSSKRSRYAEPEVVAPGLSSASRRREAERPRQMERATARAEDRQRRPSRTELPRKERISTVTCPYGSRPPKASSAVKPSDLLGGYDWARMTTKKTYVWYK